MVSTRPRHALMPPGISSWCGQQIPCPLPATPFAAPPYAELAPGHSPLAPGLGSGSQGPRPGTPLRFRRACASIAGFSARIRHEVRYRYPRGSSALPTRRSSPYPASPVWSARLAPASNCFLPTISPMCCVASSNSPISGSASCFTRPWIRAGTRRCARRASAATSGSGSLPPAPPSAPTPWPLRGRAARVGRERGKALARAGRRGLARRHPGVVTSSPMSPMPTACPTPVAVSPPMPPPRRWR